LRKGPAFFAWRVDVHGDGMSSRFWNTMQRGRGCAIETMGEEVHFSGQPGQGIVSDLRTEPQLRAGGESEGVVFRVEVSLAAGDAISDGEKAEVRGYRGCVVAKDHAGGSWFIDVGPADRSKGIQGWD